LRVDRRYTAYEELADMHRRPLAYLTGFVMILLASTAAAPSPDLLSRLPKAYARYCSWLGHEGRADELEMTARERQDAYFDGRWFGPKDSTWTHVQRAVAFPESGFAHSFSGTTDWRTLDPELSPRDDDEDCQNIVAAQFGIAPGESLLFTVGHAMESCTDNPWILWRSGDRDFRQVIPDLFQYNVQGLWHTDRYLIMNIKVEYEYGDTYEGLGFWNLDEGWIRSVVAETHVGESWGDEPQRTDPTEGLGVYLRDLAGARLLESGGVVYVDQGNARVIFWPESQEWMALP
jgi:hypothetical protein